MSLARYISLARSNTFTPASVSIPDVTYVVKYLGGKWIAGCPAGNIYVSTTGLTGSWVNHNTGLAGPIVDIEYNADEELWIAVCNPSGGSPIAFWATSADASTWTVKPDTANHTITRCITYLSTLLILGAESGSATGVYQVTVTSTTGTWKLAPWTGLTPNSVFLIGVNSVFVYLNDGTGFASGSEFTTSSALAAIGTTLSGRGAVCKAGSKFFAAVADYLAHSTDLVTWNFHYMGVSQTFYCVTGDDDDVFACGPGRVMHLNPSSYAPSTVSDEPSKTFNYVFLAPTQAIAVGADSTSARRITRDIIAKAYLSDADRTANTNVQGTETTPLGDRVVIEVSP